MSARSGCMSSHGAAETRSTAGRVAAPLSCGESPAFYGRDLAKLQDEGTMLNGCTASHVDFDEEARKLWARLNLDPSVITGGKYNALDALWQHPETRAVFYVGNQTAASNLSLLQKHGVTHVVNCTDSMPNCHEHVPGIAYHRFDIAGFRRGVKSDADAAEFVQPMLNFVSAALGDGKNVMVHCLAGAHRAGTTGIICLMYFAQLQAKEAVLAAKRCRPIIEPIGGFPELLAKLERSWREAG
ncbi:unnamed protein product [Effrenium voratum]|uniref:protein-tyrosine-phosphatase n=1 Tax=Effrenium voratum TaxID=2562239 RepID=A0AA36HWX1_9DINO|nr:unnamed protein product [Effrenium voratum]CAJ1459247.1 unnamed protein product [Effrenium voratum]